MGRAMKRPRLPKRRRARLALGVGVAILLAVGLGPFVYAWLTDSPAPFAARRFGDPMIIQADELEGRWTITDGSQVGYRVEERIGITDVTAVGRTADVTGSFTVTDGVLTSGEFVVELGTVASDRGQRDDQFRGRIMEVDTWPTAEFVLTEPAPLPQQTDTASARPFEVQGSLSLRGSTKQVTVPLLAEIVDDRLRLVGEYEIVFSEWGIPNPSLPAAFIFTASSGLLEFDLRARPD